MFVPTWLQVNDTMIQVRLTMVHTVTVLKNSQDVIAFRFIIYQILLFLLLLLTFKNHLLLLCMGVWPACLCTMYMHRPQWPEEGIRSCGMELQFADMWILGVELGDSGSPTVVCTQQLGHLSRPTVAGF